MSDEEVRRMSADDRREQILAAASIVFGERGYAGGTTDAIARQAGVSQAYVVRVFGGKENLFRETGERASVRVQESFRAVIKNFTGEETHQERRDALGMAYTNLVADRGLLLTLLHLFSLGHDPAFGPLARECFLSAYRIMRDEAGMTADQATQFFSEGMLLTVLMAMRMPDAGEDEAARELMGCAFGEKLQDLIDLSHLQSPISDATRS